MWPPLQWRYFADSRVYDGEGTRTERRLLGRTDVRQSAEEAAPERQLEAREELRRLREGLVRLPPRVREVILLRRVEGLSRHQTAERLDIRLSSVEHDLVYGIRVLVDFMLGVEGTIVRGPASGIAARERKLCRGDAEKQAASWLLRREEPGWGEADQTELDAWLDESAEHEAAFWRMEHG